MSKVPICDKEKFIATMHGYDAEVVTFEFAKQLQIELEKSIDRASKFHRLYQKAAGKLKRVSALKEVLFFQKKSLKTELADALEKIQKMKVCESCKYNDRDECGEDRCICPDTIIEKNIMGNIYKRSLCIDFNMKFWELIE